MKTNQMYRLILLLCSTCNWLSPAQAADSYNSSTGVLSISLVKVGSVFYTDVDINFSDARIGTASSTSLSYDSYNSGNNQLSIPIVYVGSQAYYNVVVTVGSVIRYRGTCSTLDACATASLYYGPAPFSSAIQTSITTPTLTAVTTLINRSRYLISDVSTASTTANYLQIGATYSTTTGYVAETGTLASSTTYSPYLSKIFQAIADTSGYFRLDSHLQPNNSLDFDASDGNKLKFRNNFGKASPTYGYVTFAYDSTSHTLQAKKRYNYSLSSAVTTQATAYTGAWTEDATFSAKDYYVKLTAGVFSLVAQANAATPLYLFNSPFDFGIPTFINPNAIPFVTNAAAPFLSKVTVAAVEGTSGAIYTQVNATYRPQVLTPGVDATTKVNADAMLASIKAAVVANGEALRYDTALYTAFRDRALTSKLVSYSIADGAPGQNLVPYVYYTNEKDSSGKYHPFMVVVTYGNQASPNGLKDIPHPPGDGSGGYPTSKVTRFSNLENYTLMIPMKDYGQVTAVTDNIFNSTTSNGDSNSNLWLDVPGTTATKNVYTWADSADNGLLIDGSVMFPVYNNTLIPSHLAGELSASGCHVGQGGGGPHCHADGYQSGLGLGLYNDSDYLNKTHPPLIGFGYDGVALFGRYRTTTDSALLGYSTALDGFGAHNHDGIGYHYHAHIGIHKPELLNYSTDMHVLMKGAYIGKINSIPYFRSSTFNSFTNNLYLGGTVH
jgi:hypothetical protein